MIESKYSHIVNDGMDITIARTVPYTGKATISRFKSTTDYTSANRRLMNLLLDSNLATGEIVQTADESFLCVVSRKEIVAGQEISIVAHGLICNATLSVVRFVEEYDEYGNPIGSTETIVINAVPCRATVINARMRQEDSGLLDDTLLKVYMPNLLAQAQSVEMSQIYDPADPENGLLKLLDKVMISRAYYQVNHINSLETPGALVVQLREWTGG